MSRGPLEIIRVVFKSHGFCLNACTRDVYASALVVMVAASLGSSILHKKRYKFNFHQHLRYSQQTKKPITASDTPFLGYSDYTSLRYKVALFLPF